MAKKEIRGFLVEYNSNRIVKRISLNGKIKKLISIGKQNYSYNPVWKVYNFEKDYSQLNRIMWVD